MSIIFEKVPNPAVETDQAVPPVSANVPVPFPIAVFPVDDVLRLSVGAVMAAVPDDKVWVNPVSPVEETDPEVEVRFRAPVVMVKPLLAVSVPDAERVVNAPLFGVVEPIVPGESQVLPSKVEALIVPVPVKLSDAPDPTTIAAVVFVPLVMLEKDVEPPPTEVHSQTLVPEFQAKT